MLINEVPIGGFIVLGETASGDEIVWRKVSTANDFVSERRVFRGNFDECEPRSQNRSRRNHGNNFFPQSNIFRWLNAVGENWFVPAHPADELTIYYPDNGFLSWFTQTELATIMEREITVAVPLGSRKEFGQEFKVKCRVCLPSASEIGYMDDRLKVEGVELPEIINILRGNRWSAVMTRTGERDAAHIVAYFTDTPDVIHADLRADVHPMIRLHGDVEVSDDPGVRYIRTPEDDRFMEAFFNIIS